jgi:hypothetical protein
MDGALVHGGVRDRRGVDFDVTEHAVSEDGLSDSEAAQGAVLDDIHVCS